MVNIKMEGDHAEIGFNDDPGQVAAEISIAVNGIYNGFKNRSPVMGKLFKKALLICLQEGGPTWERRQDMTMITVPVKKGD